MATVKVIEQPAKGVRFRYEREGRSGGLILGTSGTPQNKTYPIIQIEGYQGRALVIASCVTKDEPYRPHPHKLVGREGCHKGVCSMEVSLETMSVEFTGLGIQCVKIKEIKDSLKIRKEIRVDPFRTGFAHCQSNSLDLTWVRLCFQVFLQNEHGEFKIPLTPVVSEPIYDKRVVRDLTIVRLSKCVSPVDEETDEILLVCDKVVKNDIEIRFYEEQDGQLVWEGFGIFQPSDVYKQVVICFKPPCYNKIPTVTEPVKVYIQLRRPSDGVTSDSQPFEFLPVESDFGKLNRLRQKSRNLLRNASVPPLPKQEKSVAMLFPETVQTYTNNNPIDVPNPVIPPQRQFSLPMNIVMDTTTLVPNSLYQFLNLELNEPSTSGNTLNPNSETNYDYLKSVYTSNLPSSSLQRNTLGTTQNPDGGGVSVYTSNLPSSLQGSTLGTTQNSNVSVYTGNLPSASLQGYSTSVDFLSPISSPTNPESNLLFHNIEHVPSSQNYNTKKAIIKETQNSIDRSNSSEMNIPTFINNFGITDPSEMDISTSSNNLDGSNSSERDIPSCSSNLGRNNFSEMDIPAFNDLLIDVDDQVLQQINIDSGELDAMHTSS